MRMNVCGSLKRMAINSLFCFLLQTMLTIFTAAPKGTNAIVQHLCAKHNHHCVVKIPPCSSWTTKIAPLQRSELDWNSALNVSLFSCLRFLVFSFILALFFSRYLRQLS